MQPILERMASMETAESATPSYIHLNVGGTYYTTSLSTLTRYPESMLAVMFNQEDIPLARDETGRYIIDRDGATFRYILNFLRGGNLNLPPTFTDYYQLKEEVDFYQLDDMKELLELWRVMNWKEDKINEIERPLRTRYNHTKQIGSMAISCQSPPLQSHCSESMAFRTYLLHNHYEDHTHTKDPYNKTFENDPVTFRYMYNFVRGKGNYMPNNTEELKKLREAADFYDEVELREVLNNKTTHFPTFRIKKL